MAKKTFSLLSLSLFTIILLGSLISASLTVSTVSLDSLENTKATFTIENKDNSSNVTITLNNYTIRDDNNKEVTIHFNPSALTIKNSSSATVEASVSSIDSDFQLGTYTETYIIKEDGESSNNATLTLSFEKTICEYANEGDLTVSIEDIKVIEKDNLKSFGDDEDWFPLDEIEVEIEIENKGKWDIEDIELEWGLYDESEKEWIIELDDEKEFDLDEDEDETITLNFKFNEKTLDVDFDELNDNCKLIIKATGKIDDKDSEYDGNFTSDSDSEEIKIILEKDFVILNNIEIPENAFCGEELHITADVYNIGEKDQDDVYIEIYSKALEIYEKIEIGDIDAFDKESLDVTIRLPENVKSKTYEISLEVYDEDNDVYEADNDDELAKFFALVSLEGGATESKASLSANLESSAKAGEQLIVKTVIKNTGEEISTYTINTDGYSSWATLNNIDQTTFTLNAGESKEIKITLDVNKEVSGENRFYIEAFSQGKTVLKQPIAISIEEAEPEETNMFSYFTKLTENNNWHLWAIGGVNLILIIAIIIVAFKVAKK